MSNKNKRTTERAPRFILNGQGIEDFNLTGREKKRVRKLHERYIKRAHVLTPAEIPAGSVIADKTMEDIKAGRYSLARPVITTPARSRLKTLRQKRKLVKLSRRRNRK